jgi:hypothetical protein
MKSTVITITAGDKPVDVISEKIVEEGRQRFPNGVDRLAPEESMQFLMHETQSLRVVVVDEPEPTVEPTEFTSFTPETPEA